MERIRAEVVVIGAQDTTEADLTRKEEKVGGPLNDENHWGLYVHPVLVMTPQRVPLGIVHVQMWSRDPAEFKKSSKQRRDERRKKAFEEKESYRWLKGYEALCQVAAEAPDTTVVCVSDSEGDVYECLAAGASGEGRRAEWIIRGCQDRALLEEDKNLPQLLACQAALGTMTVQVSKREASTGDDRKRRQPRESRKAKVTVRSVRTLLNPPARPGEKLPPVYVKAILVREENPPPGEEPIEWLLLTSLAISTFEECCTVIGYYCCRWEIEVFFRVLKSGCKIEESAVPACRPHASLLGHVHDRGLAGAVCFDVGPGMSALQLRGRLIPGGMEIGVRNGERHRPAEKATDLGGDDPSDRWHGRVLESHRRWAAGSANNVDRHAADA